MDQILDKKLAEAYFTPSAPVAFSGARNILSKYKRQFPEDNINHWLDAQNAYTLHKPIRYKFPRIHYTVTNIDDLWEADLVEMRSFKTDNNGFSYILVVIDVLSKYVWVEPLKNKSAPEVLEGFKKILKRSGDRRPVCIQTDKGKEFVAGNVQKFLSDEKIQFRVARNPDIKAAVVERFNRTLKERMWRYFTYSRTHKYIHVLQQIVDAYNHSKHSSIKMTPAAVTIDNAGYAWRNIQNRFTKEKPRKSSFKYKVGDYVRISKSKGAFEKGYEGNWSKEFFQITKAVLKQSLPTYELKDLAGEAIEGFFYEPELVLVNKDVDKDPFIVERIIRSKGKGKDKQIFVQWEGYPAKFNTWIPASNLHDIAKK